MNARARDRRFLSCRLHLRYKPPSGVHLLKSLDARNNLSTGHGSTRCFLHANTRRRGIRDVQALARLLGDLPYPFFRPPVVLKGNTRRRRAATRRRRQHTSVNIAYSDPGRAQNAVPSTRTTRGGSETAVLDLVSAVSRGRSVDILVFF